MRSIVFIACIIAALDHRCSSLPFGSRPRPAAAVEEEQQRSNDNVDQQQREAEKTAVRGAASKVSHSPGGEVFAASPAVDAYFQSSGAEEDSTRLSDALRQVAGTREMRAFLTTTRRSLHRAPELMYELPHTSDTIRAVLDELGIPYTAGWAKNAHPDVFPGTGGYGIVAEIGTRREDQPCVILRADMDALPIREATEGIDAFRSATPGQMHACGHDGHVTMLLGAASVLKQAEKDIVGTVRLVFQPAEEGGAGMKRMVEEGVVTRAPEAQLAFGMHVWPTLPTGVIASRPGPLMAAAEMFTIVLHGKGGHAAMPHLTIDPIVAASSLVVSLQTIVARTLSPLEAGVVSVTAVAAGDAFNVIPAEAVLRGTIRALSTERLLSMRERVGTMAAAAAALHGCNATVTYSPDFYPPTINDPGLFDWAAGVGARVSREGRVRDTEPTMGGEDFAFLAAAVPAAFFFLGQGTAGDERQHVPRTDYGLHHPSFALDEEVLPTGVELHANLALRALKKLLVARESEETTKAEL